VKAAFLGLGIIAGIAAAVIIALLAFNSLRVPLKPTTSGYLVPKNCSPGPCANIKGFSMWVSNVRIEGTLVRMQVKFQNSSVATHASPEDLQLVDTSRHSSPVVTDTADCQTWDRKEFKGGATFGPLEICFRVYNATPPFILHWAPDLGAFCCETDIKISPG
jgi:hypothetical protein